MSDDDDSTDRLYRALVANAHKTATGVLVDPKTLALVRHKHEGADIGDMKTFCGFRLIENPLLPPHQAVLVDNAGSILATINLEPSE